MEKVQIIVIGAGIVGLAIAYELSKHYTDIVVVDKELSFGKHTSSRNSEVIHSGLYYPKNSLKARLCVEGNNLLYDYLKSNSIPHKNTGKLVVATTFDEKEEVTKLYNNGCSNNIKGLKILSHEDVNIIEPDIKAHSALFVPSTGILDTHKLMKDLETKIETNEGFIIYDMEVTDIRCKQNEYILTFINGEKIAAKTVVNSAGLYSDKIAEMVGVDLQKNNLKIQLCKGEYYKYSGKHNIKHLIYPVPDPKGIFLGIHLTKNLNNELRFGPNAYYVNEISYSMNESFKKQFLEAISHYYDIEEYQLHPDDTGIRPKLQGYNEDFRDFYIKNEQDKGFNNFINLIGIESPGLTSCLAIAKYIKKIINEV